MMSNKSVVFCIDLDEENDVAVEEEEDKEESSKELTKGSTNKTPLLFSQASSLLDDDDSDSSMLLAGGPVFQMVHSSQPQHHQKSKRTEAREKKSRERAEEKQQQEQRRRQETEQRKEIRQQQTLQRDEQRRHEQERKKRRIEQMQQISGKFAAKEIVVLVDQHLMHTMGPAVVTGLQEAYTVHSHHSEDDTWKEGCIQWIRRDYLSGGASKAKESFQQNISNGYQLLDRFVIVFHDPKRFLPLLQRSEDDNDYPLLEAWLLRLPKGKRIVLMLYQVKDELHRQWNAHRRNKQSTPPPTDIELNDAIVWLLVQFRVECIICPLEDDLLSALCRMTRALSEEPYQQDVTELECIKKIKSSSEVGNDAFSKAKDCWIRQLQQVPLLGENKARQLARYFPTARSLWEAYQDPNKSEMEKRMLVAHLLCEDKQYPKLSDSLYRLMTTTTPKERL